MKSRLLVALMMATTLAGCGIFKGGQHRPKTAVLGERIPVLTSDTDAEIDPALADQAVTVPAAVSNDAWAQASANPQKAPGNVALGASLSRAWTAHIEKSSPKARYAAAPVAAQGRVYVIDTHAVVHAFSLQDGARLWQTGIYEGGAKPEKKADDDDKAGGKAGRKEKGRKRNRGGNDKAALFGGGVSFDDGKLYATDGLGDLVALDAASGKVLWRKRPGGPLRGAPTVASGIVYTVSQDNQIFALRQDNGDTLWSQSATLQASGVFGVASPAVARGTVVAGFSSGELTAMRYENGHSVWGDQLSRTSISTAVASISDIDASPVIADSRVYAIGQGGRMVSIDLLSGQRIWELSISGIDTPAVGGDWVFVVSDQSKVYCIARATGKVRWVAALERWKNEKKRSGDVFWAGPVLAGGRLILVSTRGDVVELGLDGKVIREDRAGKHFGQSPVIANGTMLLLDDKGILSAWR